MFSTRMEPDSEMEMQPMLVSRPSDHPVAWVHLSSLNAVRFQAAPMEIVVARTMGMEKCIVVVVEDGGFVDSMRTRFAPGWRHLLIAFFLYPEDHSVYT